MHPHHPWSSRELLHVQFLPTSLLIDVKISVEPEHPTGSGINWFPRGNVSFLHKWQRHFWQERNLPSLSLRGFAMGIDFRAKRGSAPLQERPQARGICPINKTLPHRASLLCHPLVLAANSSLGPHSTHSLAWSL